MRRRRGSPRGDIAMGWLVTLPIWAALAVGIVLAVRLGLAWFGATLAARTAWPVVQQAGCWVPAASAAVRTDTRLGGGSVSVRLQPAGYAPYGQPMRMAVLVQLPPTLGLQLPPLAAGRAGVSLAPTTDGSPCIPPP